MVALALCCCEAMVVGVCLGAVGKREGESWLSMDRLEMSREWSKSVLCPAAWIGLCAMGVVLVSLSGLSVLDCYQ